MMSGEYLGIDLTIPRCEDDPPFRSEGSSNGDPMPKSLHPPLDRLFRVLADPTRRRVLERLGAGPATAGQLAEGAAGMAFPSFLQHLRALEECGLVESAKKGRVRTYRLIPGRLAPARDWLAAQRTLWERRLDQLDAHLLQLKEQDR